ncbi:MAG: hypothetical protein NUV92_01480 [Ignavibacteria bacterium]|nr:hypothetical protein [Ignavibacteria bacterium]MDH7527713.1 hypothetical protein [Ignavibacteria bacterium]
MFKQVLVLLFFCASVSLFAQQEFLNLNEQQEVFENQPIKISFEVVDNVEIQQAFLYYRTFGRVEVSVVEMNIQGRSISAIIPPDYVVFPYVEYYIKVLTTTGNVLSYPYRAVETGNFYRINVKKKEQTDETIILLSPDPEEPTTKNDFFLAISLLRVSPKVKKEFTRIWINNDEITSLLSFNYDLIYLPQGFYKNLIVGNNNLKIVLYDSSGKPLHISNFNFRIIPLEEKIVVEKRKFKYNGIAKIESNYESMRTGNFNFNRLNAQFSGNYGSINSNLNIFVTNEEKSYLQPQNRFLLSFDADVFKLLLGDHYPNYPTLIMNGKRLRGVTGNLELGFFNLLVSYGEITRKVEGELIQLYSRDSAVIGSNVIPIDSAKFGQPFARVNLGTYQRRLFAIRPYFGKGKNFQLGFTYLHSKDNMTSIEFGARPKENVVVGSDLLIGIDNQRILFRAQGAFSLLNNDISTGNFTDKIIDSLFGPDKPFGGDPDLIKKVRDIGKNFITVNQFIIPLNPQELPTLAAEASLSLNYFGNYFRTAYIYRGNEYTSFGQNYLRNDIKGLQLMDRIGLFENRVFFSVSYENLNDNLQKTKITTTNFQNFESSISLYLRKNFPNLTLGYSNYKVKNDIDPVTADSIRRLNYLNDITHQISFSSNYDLRWQVLHRILLNVITSRKKDYSFRNLSAKFYAINLSIQNFWNKRFSTFWGTTINSSEISNSKYGYYSFTAGSRINSFKDKLRTTISINPSFGDLKRTIFDFFNQYYLRQNFSINFSLRYLFNSRPLKNESILNFTAQYEF